MEDNPDHDIKLDMLVVARVLESGNSRNNSNDHPMFCQMNQLTNSGSDIVWTQVARWIKFEEFLDEAANRWSKPHVPSLPMHALHILKKELRHCPLLFDPDVTDFSSLVDKLTSAWVQGGYLDHNMVDGIKMALLKPHRHAHEGKLQRPPSTASNLLNVHASGMGGSSVSLHSLESARDGSPYNSSEELSNAEVKGTPRTLRKNAKFERKVPKNAVATNILIGELTSLRRPLVAMVRLSPARHLGWLCEVRLATQFLFVCLAPETETTYDVREIGRCMGTMMIDPIFRELADGASNRYEILAGMTEFTTSMTALPSCVWNPKTRLEPPPKIPNQDKRRIAKKILEERRHRISIVEFHEDDEEGLQRTGKLFGGLVDDVKRKLPWYFSDFKDALSVQCVASTIFLFLATLTPNITFGGLLGEGTDQYMGTMECILAASICGVVFALFSGQPLNILGSTGPMLVLEVIIFKFCKDHDWDFLPFRVWIGLWTSFILLLIVAFDLSALIRYITRFTEECFACLIAMIFIYEAFKKTFKITEDYPVHLGGLDSYPGCSFTDYNKMATGNGNDNNSFTTTSGPVFSTMSSINSNNTTTSGKSNNADNHHCDSSSPDIFFLSLIEFLFTFGIAFTLVAIRNSIYFPNVVRRMMSDFGVLIAILIIVGIDALMGIDTPKLEVPQTFSPTRADRPWFINPASDKNPWWLALAAFLPALLATILVFMDQQITAVIVNRKEHKLKKGSGYHLDILVLAILITVMSILGLPWYVAATVSALAHVMSLKVESDCTAPGEKPEFLGVREQRVTGLLVGILSGLSVFLTGVLKFIPLPVLYGVFLFMGIRALNGMQLADRVMLYFVSPKYQPDYAYLRHVPLMRVHIYTLIQLVCLAGLWIVKMIKATSIAFPLMVLATCFTRKLLDNIFTQYELMWLDHLLPVMSNRKKLNKMGFMGGAAAASGGKQADVVGEDETDHHNSVVTIPAINVYDDAIEMGTPGRYHSNSDPTLPHRRHGGGGGGGGADGNGEITSGDDHHHHDRENNDSSGVVVPGSPSANNKNNNSNNNSNNSDKPHKSVTITLG